MHHHALATFVFEITTLVTWLDYENGGINQPNSHGATALDANLNISDYFYNSYFTKMERHSGIRCENSCDNRQRHEHVIVAAGKQRIGHVSHLTLSEQRGRSRFFNFRRKTTAADALLSVRTVCITLREPFFPYIAVLGCFRRR